MSEEMINRNAGEKATIIGIIVNLVLSVLKIIAGKVLNSMSLLSDGIHSLSDLVTDFITFFSYRLANKPADEDHQYGHGKFETLASVIIGFILLYVAFKIVIESIFQIYSHKSIVIGFPFLIIAVTSILGKEILFHYTKKIAEQNNSPVLLSNAYHHRSDAMSSLVVLVGGGAQYLGYHHGDQLAAIIVGIMISACGISIIKEGLGELTEKSAGENVENIISKRLDSMEEIEGWHKIRSRRIGGIVYVDFHIQVDPLMSVLESHSIAGLIKDEISSDSSVPMNILIHVEPAEFKKDGNNE